MALTAQQREAVTSDSDFRAALEIVERGVTCASEYLRDGCLILDMPCRMTVGRLALLQMSRNCVFTDSNEPPTEQDVLSAIYLCADEYLDRSVWIADNPVALDKSVKQFTDKLTRRMRRRAVSEFSEWMNRVAAALHQTRSSGSGKIRPLWWVSVVDIIASEYHWSDHYILWNLSLVRAARYQEMIAARKSGTEISDDISDNVAHALDVLENVLTKGKSNGTGKT